MDHPSWQRIKEVISYNPETGVFKWNYIRRGVRPGRPAGCVRKHGYLLLTIDRKRLLAHRVAVLYMTGAWPVGNIDHIDGDPSNNKFSNLRDVTQQMNVQNIKKATRRNLSSGLLGVSYHQRDRLWRARIYVNGKSHTWYAKTKEDAHRIYLEAKRKLHDGSTL